MERGAASAGLGLATQAAGGSRDPIAGTMTAPRPGFAQTAAAGASLSACTCNCPLPGSVNPGRRFGSARHPSVSEGQVSNPA